MTASRCAELLALAERCDKLLDIPNHLLVVESNDINTKIRALRVIDEGREQRFYCLSHDDAVLLWDALQRLPETIPSTPNRHCAAVLRAIAEKEAA